MHLAAQPRAASSTGASAGAGTSAAAPAGTSAEAAARQPGSGADVLHLAASAFVTGADRAVLAGAIVVAAGLVVAFRAFRPARAEVSAEAPADVAAEAPARVLETTGA